MKTKRETAMGLPERLILEFVRDHPGNETTEIGRALEMYERTSKRAVATLLQDGYLKRVRFGKRRSVTTALAWTGKEFPASADFVIPSGRLNNLRYVDKALLAAKARRDAISTVCDGMRAMLAIRRAAA
ncbi:hypothetical protein [Burkholderia pyrrocinia]|uniref:hypothetical protein n=1 Tax=Burkholderia pyrrocinia TaxID=60550 RepID=UPI002AB30E66|nr:hypothetical protein [Burkholderia pyrrocinia]